MAREGDVRWDLWPEDVVVRPETQPAGCSLAAAHNSSLFGSDRSVRRMVQATEPLAGVSVNTFAKNAQDNSLGLTQRVQSETIL